MPRTCNRKKSDMTPCVITDGPVAYCEDNRGNPICVGCERTPAETRVDPPVDWNELVGGRICDYCRPWCATSRAQLAQRQVNMREFPEVKPHICPQCGGTEWATTDAQIPKDEPA